MMDRADKRFFMRRGITPPPISSEDVDLDFFKYVKSCKEKGWL